MDNDNTPDLHEEIPYGYCQCGCGQKTGISDRTVTRLGWKKGEPRHFIHNHHKNESIESRFWKYVKKLGADECWEWQGGRNRFGYGIFIHKRAISTIASRTAYELTRGPIPEGMIVCHKCDNPSCCNPAHLFLGTHTDNVHDRDAKGRAKHPKGSQNKNAKLTEKHVSEIRARFLAGESRKSLASAYHVTHATVKDIISRRSWKHVQ